MKEKNTQKRVEKELSATAKDIKVECSRLTRAVSQFVKERAFSDALDVVTLQGILREIRSLTSEVKLKKSEGR